MFDQKTFSIRLKSLRLSRQLTLDRIGKDFNSSKGTFANLENCKKLPSLHMVCALADYFDVSIDYLVGRSDDPARR